MGVHNSLILYPDIFVLDLQKLRELSSLTNSFMVSWYTTPPLSILGRPRRRCCSCRSEAAARLAISCPRSAISLLYLILEARVGDGMLSCLCPELKSSGFWRKNRNSGSRCRNEDVRRKKTRFKKLSKCEETVKQLKIAETRSLSRSRFYYIHYIIILSVYWSVWSSSRLNGDFML